MKETESVTDKPGARHAGWRPIRSRVAYASKRLRVREDEVAPPGQQPHTYAYAETPPGLVIVPVTPEGTIALIHQFRYACDARLLELPAGSLGDQGDRSLEDVARLELKQEIGATCGALEEVATYFESPANGNQRTHALIAWETRIQGDAEREPGEDLSVEIVPAAEALERVRMGEMQSAPCALALLLAEPRLAARGLLESSSAPTI